MEVNVFEASDTTLPSFRQRHREASAIWQREVEKWQFGEWFKSSSRPFSASQAVSSVFRTEEQSLNSQEQLPATSLNVPHGQKIKQNDQTGDENSSLVPGALVLRHTDEASVRQHAQPWFVPEKNVDLQHSLRLVKEVASDRLIGRERQAVPERAAEPVSGNFGVSLHVELDADARANVWLGVTNAWQAMRPSLVEFVRNCMRRNGYLVRQLVCNGEVVQLTKYDHDITTKIT